MYDLARFTLRDMTECAAALRTLGAGAASLEEVTDRIVRYLFDYLGDERTKAHGCALVRFFKTYAYGDLDEDSQRFVQDMLGRPPKSPAMKCLTLTATAGEQPDWNVKGRSRRYKVVPLASPQFVAQFPMLTQLFKQFGVEMQTDREPDSDLLMDWDEKTYNVFYIPDAVDSPYVPVQQDFVVACGIRSVLGFGGILPSNDLFTVILFSKVSVPRETAELFKTLAVSVKLAVLPFASQAFHSQPPEGGLRGETATEASRTGTEMQWRRSQITALEQLLAVHERTVIADYTQRARAETALQQSEHRFRSLVECARDIIAAIAKDGTITSLNPAFEAVTQWAPSEWIGKPIAPLVHPDDLPTARELFRYVMEKGTALTWSLRIRTKQHEWVTGEIVGVPQTEDGSVVGVLAITRDITERRAVEEALRHSEEQVRSIVQSTSDAILTIDAEGCIMFWNSGAAKMFGYSAQDVIGKPVTIIIPERFREAHERGIARARAAGRVTVTASMFELVGLRKDGTEFPLEFSLASWTEKSRLFFTGIIRDITERKRGEEALRASEERLRIALDAVHMGIWDWNVATNAITWSDHVRHIFGVSEDAWPGTYTAYLSLIHPQDHDRVVQAVTDCIEKRAEYSVEHRIIWPDGSLHWVACKGDVLRDDGGKAVRMLGTVMEITDRKLTEKALQEIRERFIAAFGYAAIGMAVVATDGRFLQVNEALCRILGYSGSELLGMTFQSITYPDDLPLNLARRDQMLTADTPTFYMEKRYLHKLGHIVWTELSVALVRDSHGQPSYFISQIQDITERKREEEAFRQRAERFEKQQATLVRLTQSKTIQGSDLAMRLQCITEEAAETLGVDRVSIWRYANDREMIQCVDLYELAAHRHSAGQELRVSSYPSYFKALAEHQIIAADSAHQDPRTAEFSDSYLSALGIGSMMDIPIYHLGRLEGVMCCEHVGPPRQWMQDEQMFAIALSNLVSLAYEQWERKQAESARRESDERFSTFMRHFPAVAFMKDTLGRHLYINERLEQTLHIARHDWYMKTNDELFPIPTSTKLNEHDRAVLNTGQSHQFIETTSLADGIHHWLVTKFPIRDERGVPFLLGGVGIDITERKRAEEALRRSERELADFFENGAVGLHWVGANGIILKANKRELDLLGYRRDEYVGHHIAEFHVDQEVVRDILRRFSAGETLRGYEARLRCKDGTVRHVLIDSNVYREDGKFVDSRCFTRDITEQKRAEELLQNSLSQLRTLSARLEAVREEERARIARELHDELGVGLTCHKIDLSRLSTMMGDAIGPEHRRKADSQTGRRTVDEKIRSMMDHVDTTIAA
ncbi:MAG TPA: PAS domain S-box protein, partial [Nitrospiraceae bacterium]|nr:PAS domain S-box protein [Nitrospiraceae bacterium]